MKVLTRLILSSSLLFASHALAQGTDSPPIAAPSPKAQSIQPDLLQKYIALTAINGCMLLEDKISFSVVLKNGVGAVAGVVYTDYASTIAGINENKPLEQRQLANGIGLDLSLQIVGRCEKLVPAEELKKIKEFVRLNSPKN